jgi:hypothetical protein
MAVTKREILIALLLSAAGPPKHFARISIAPAASENTTPAVA